MDSEIYDTIIIGAGMAGASTAYHLLYENNYKGRVLILEARNRIGGRIHGQTIAGKHVELGANWIHGLIGNPIYELAVKYNLIDPIKNKPDENPYESGNVCGFTSEGEPVPISLISSAYQHYFWILKRADDVHNRVCRGEMIEECSVGEYLGKEINNYLLTKNEDERPLLKAIFDQMIKREGVINGCNSLDEISLRYFGLYREFSGGNMIIPPGFQYIVQGLLDDTMIKTQEKNDNQFKLLLNHVVEKIKWPGVDSKDKEQQVEVICANGKVFKCNHLVNTMPVGVLKAKIKQLYEPSIPQYKIEAVNALGFDYVNKIYLEYENPLCPEFIDSTVSEIMVFWKNESKEARNDVEKNWVSKIYSFSKITDRLLLGWLSGKEARYSEKLDEETLSKKITELFRSMYKNPEFPAPSKIVQTTWGSDEFKLGAYSHMRLGSSGKDLEMLAQPIFSDPGSDKPILLFAGEGTHPFYFSTTHGAFLSGKKAASYLLDN